MVRQGRKILFVFLMLGFFIGILYANVIPKAYIESFSVFGQYFLNIYKKENMAQKDMIKYLIVIRSMPFLLFLIPREKVIRKVCLFMFLIWTGFSFGVYLTSGILMLKMKGLILATVILFPQVIFYVPSYYLIVWYLYNYPKIEWSMAKTIVVILFVFIGVFCEENISTVFLQMFVNMF